MLMIMFTPMLRILSVPVALLGLAALRQLAVMPFCVANTPRVVCASLVPGAAVPWNVYRLKIAETQSALKPILFFYGNLWPFVCLLPCEEDATYRPYFQSLLEQRK